MPLPGALLNPGLGVEVRALLGVVGAARAMDASGPLAQVTSSRRPGWAARLALEVLREAGGEPMHSGEVRRAIEARFGERVHKDTLLYALKRSRAARDGRIMRNETGWYAPQASALTCDNS